MGWNGSKDVLWRRGQCESGHPRWNPSVCRNPSADRQLFEFLSIGEDLEEFYEAFPTVEPADVVKFLQESSAFISSYATKAAA